ncbi:membrane protein insertase YidC [Geobacter pickeringii]|uniref:Membrane protein insertase YidC n=1 Tax=Geobacter pickeringii TaxID=345632 RepID=A0A0B5BJT6_9BACT|nr:membrane protein insertase YidC [Geobacter pickeringii]AJE04755.1 membrane protein [Geobacter pickeringii]
MEKRALIAVVLSILVFYGYAALFPAKRVEGPAAPVSTTQEQAKPSTSAVSAPAAGSAAPTATGARREITVDSPAYTAVFSTQGGNLVRLVLKKYHEAADLHSKNVTLVDDSAQGTVATVAPWAGFDRGTSFSPSTDTLSVGAGEAKELVFTGAAPGGVTIRKTYRFQGGDYGIGLEYTVANGGAGRVAGPLQTVLNYQLATDVKESRFETHGPVLFAQDKLIVEKAKDLTAQARSYSAPLWSGFADKYFLSALVAKEGSMATASVKALQPGKYEELVSSPEIALNPGESRAVAYRLYFGPKDLDILKGQGGSLERAIDLGWFAVLAKPLLHALKFFYHYVGNYGVAIIIITVILKILFYPLTHSSYKSMKQMQKLQPKMQELREKYKNDREAMNRAIMELYQTHKVNPVGGCLPMIVQIPVFFALYKALMFSIELRHAPFFLWIQDLAAKDPYYVTPIIMGVTMVVQQKMTPSQMDPVQQKMMMALPVVFTFMFLNFPSGLVLYWLVNNVLTITQQYYINKSINA